MKKFFINLLFVAALVFVFFPWAVALVDIGLFIVGAPGANAEWGAHRVMLTILWPIIVGAAIILVWTGVFSS